MNAEESFAKLVGAFADDDRVTPPEATRRAFGSNGLKVDGKIFAMLVRGSLVLKLPKERVAALLAAGEGAPFDTGGGRVMKEWVVLRLPERAWLALAREAQAFVGGAAAKKPAPKRSRK
ncbi:MAG TPA: TfoX/Sxy family protein [Polyangiaceae bacterium]|jgi:TfoX/Sxy family transcriptional regulator of competence genes|nr:TfoX/Sxy family protein [Polyangiaceae bacterium]